MWDLERHFLVNEPFNCMKQFNKIQEAQKSSELQLDNQEWNINLANKDY